MRVKKIGPYTKKERDRHHVTAARETVTSVRALLNVPSHVSTAEIPAVLSRSQQIHCSWTYAYT